jgi:hypothetical protein
MPEKDEKSDLNTLILAKLDALTKAIEAMVPKEDSKPKKDPIIEKAEVALRNLLKDNLPKEKLDSMDLHELTIAAEIIPIKHVTLNEPPKGKTDAKDVSYADEMKKVVFK